LSYDEKPLLLFQRLKDSGQRPVFMLRHIRDIRSPVVVAQEKRAAKLGLPPNTNVLPTIEPTATSPTRTTGANATNGDRQHRTPGESNFPELPSPGSKEGHDSEGNVKPTSPQPNGTVVDRDGNVHKVTYAISIYPYIADKTDEFDVAVGAIFVVMSKAKGWWFVQKDPEGRGNIVSDSSRSAWVPAGCLLELTAPVASVSPATPGMPPGRAPIPPTNIISSSYPGKALMDFTSKDDNELNLKEGDKIRVYKKYCHWSYRWVKRVVVITDIAVSRKTRAREDGSRRGLSAGFRQRRRPPTCTRLRRRLAVHRMCLLAGTMIDSETRGEYR